MRSNPRVAPTPARQSSRETMHIPNARDRKTLMIVFTQPGISLIIGAIVTVRGTIRNRERIVSTAAATR